MRSLGCEKLIEQGPLHSSCGDNRATFYSPDPVVGYTDYKFLDQIEPGTKTKMHYERHNDLCMILPRASEDPHGLGADSLNG